MSELFSFDPASKLNLYCVYCGNTGSRVCRLLSNRVLDNKDLSMVIG